MKFGELLEKIENMNLQPGDTVKLVNNDNSFQKVVLTGTINHFNNPPKRYIPKKRIFDYAFLSGLTMHFIEGKKKDMDLPFADIERWVPETQEEKEAVEKIKQDLEKGTYLYIK